MFKFDLKELWFLSKSVNRTLIRHKRVKCGKLSFILCYTVFDGFLTVLQAKHVHAGRTTKRSRRLRRPQMRPQRRLEQRLEETSSATNVCLKDIMPRSTSATTFIIPMITDVGTQTPLPAQGNAYVDTLDLSLKISRDQQTVIKQFNTLGSQTKCKVETRSTQMVLDIKAKGVQTAPEPCNTRASYAQTVTMVQLRHSQTQTLTPTVEEEKIGPYEQLLHMLLRAISNQSQLLLGNGECLQQLVESKQLELEKQRLESEARTALSVREARSSQAAKVKRLNAKTARHKRGKHRCFTHLPHRKPQTKTKPTLVVGQTQTLATPTECKGTQTERQRKVAHSMAATQTDRDKGFLWRRRK